MKLERTERRGRCNDLTKEQISFKMHFTSSLCGDIGTTFDGNRTKAVEVSEE